MQVRVGPHAGGGCSAASEKLRTHKAIQSQILALASAIFSMKVSSACEVGHRMGKRVRRVHGH